MLLKITHDIIVKSLGDFKGCFVGVTRGLMASTAFMRRGFLYTVYNFQVEEMADGDRTPTAESKPAPNGDANSDVGGIFTVGDSSCDRREKRQI